MCHVVAIPIHAKGKFRLSAADMQELWHFTLKRTGEYANMIQEELTELARKSTFEDTMTMKAKEISDSFWKESNARPTKDVATVASHLLAMLLGGDIVLQSLEESDKTLIIEPIFSGEADSHLLFWGAKE
jgi:hypothetical protein